jgi:hypothetical protein
MSKTSNMHSTLSLSTPKSVIIRIFWWIHLTLVHIKNIFYSLVVERKLNLELFSYIRLLNVSKEETEEILQIFITNFSYSFWKKEKMCLFTYASDSCLALASVFRWLASQILQANNCPRTNDRNSYVNDDCTPHFHSCVRSHNLEVLWETDIMIA